MQNFNYDFLSIVKQNPDNEVILDFGTGNLQFLLSEDPSITTGNSWEAPLLNMLNNSLAGLGNKIDMAKQFTGSNTVIGHYRESIKYYKGSQCLDLRIDGVLIATNKNDDLIEKIKPLLELSNPDFNAKTVWKIDNLTMKAPLGYSSDPDLDDGKIAVKLGRWFKSSRVYVLSSATTTGSKAKLPNGKPAYFNIQISLTPCRVLSKDEVTGFLI